ncbi:ankyrin [Gonapodya prolifera JEL478]|uniref:Ankyrin n=1 Tax=Gonapodya prolifera (strain JEL478) TaxID=1344416 RepID=A0A139AKY4_GONPJ|nr:ankyrin [Gonapodya prolifera JEL478]|eukprot:KXS17153.1 ankyrin [Gonapodya prolifera JEL478]
MSPLFRLLALPTELIQRVGVFCADHRLAFPTPALNRYLHAIFSFPTSIATRALRHFPSSEAALLAESLCGDAPVLAILCRRMPRAILSTVPALGRAAWAGHLAAVQCLLDAGADPNVGENNQAIVAAAYQKSADIVRLLLHRGATNKQEALLMAAQRGSVACVRELLAHGAHPDALMLWGGVVQSGVPELVEVLLQDGRVRAVMADDENTVPRALIFAAVQCGHAETTLLILKHLPDTHALKDGLVLNAASRGHADVVKVLLDSGADLKQCGGAAIRVATEKGHDRVLQVFRERGFVDL